MHEIPAAAALSRKENADMMNPSIWSVFRTPTAESSHVTTDVPFHPPAYLHHCPFTRNQGWYIAARRRSFQRVVIQPAESCHDVSKRDTHFTHPDDLKQQAYIR
jgi:hypothetical protein